MASRAKKPQADMSLSDIYERLDELQDEIREHRGEGAGTRRRGAFPPFMPGMPPAMLAWMLSGAFSPRRRDRDFDWYGVIRRFADTRDDFWDRIDDCAYDSAEAM